MYMCTVQLLTMVEVGLYWPIMAHYVLKLLQQKPQQCGAIKAVEFISQVLSPLLLRPTITIRFNSKWKTLFAQHWSIIVSHWRQ